jgi:hypothetical protein
MLTVIVSILRLLHGDDTFKSLDQLGSYCRTSCLPQNSIIKQSSSEERRIMAPQMQKEDDPSKHSEEFFAERILVLQNSIKEKIPSLDSAPLQEFLDSCKAFESCNDSKEKAEDLLKNLTKKKADEDAIKKAQDLVDACEHTIEVMWNCEIDAGSRVLDTLDLMSLEETLVECTILVQATPKRLAAFCASDGSNGRLVDEFLSNKDWMKLMILHGGASKGNYGKAILIHSKLLTQIKDNSTEVRRKLALAVALELATDITIFHRKGVFVDPFDRFWHYVNAYENNELDDKFEKFTVWELRKVVDCDATNEDLQWGRDYLKAYRPDEMLSTNDRWKYVLAVKSDVSKKKSTVNYFETLYRACSN